MNERERLTEATALLERVEACYADNEEGEELVRDVHAFLRASPAQPAESDATAHLHNDGDRFRLTPPEPTLLERIEDVVHGWGPGARYDTAADAMDAIAGLISYANAVTVDRNEWRAQQENLLMMYRDSEARTHALRQAIGAAIVELDRFGAGMPQPAFRALSALKAARGVT